MLKLNDIAPDQKLSAYQGGEFKEIALADYKNQWIVLFFYPRDFTFVCPTELTGFAKHADEFAKMNTQVLACSTDSVFSHKAWFERDLAVVKYPVLADTAHNFTRLYGVLNEDDGQAERGTFIIDPDGKIRYILVSDSNVGRSIPEIIRVLQALQNGGLCPVDWEPGDKTL